MTTSRNSRPAKSLRSLGVFLLAAIFVAAALAGCGESSSDTATSPTDASSVTSEPDAGTETTESPPEDGAEFTTVTFATDDGLTLDGRMYAPSTSSSSWVILCHMYPADQTSWHEEALAMAALGYNVLTFDFRGYGASQGEKDIQYLDRDVTAAVTYAQGAGAQEVVLAGASMGGTACLVSAAELQTLSSIRIAGVATLSAPVEFMGLSANEAATEVTVPLLFIAAEDDEGASGANQLYSLSGNQGDLQIVSGAEHGTNLFMGAEADTVRQSLQDFVTENMPVGS